MTINTDLTTAQKAIEFPEVQEMVRRLAAYGLGVFMPHMHDEAGNMLPLPEGVVQVEEDLAVSFKTADQVADASAYVTVGWAWSAAGPGSKLVCKLQKQSNGEWKHVGVQQSN